MNWRNYIALKNDASAEFWGEEYNHSNYDGVDSLLIDVKEVIPNGDGFLIIKNDDTLFPIGNSDLNTGVYELEGELVNIESAVGTNKSFAALREDDVAIFWANEGSHIEPNIKSLHSAWHSIVAIRNDGSLFGFEYGSLLESGHPTQLNDVQSLAFNDWAWAALKGNKTIYTWGRDVYGGNSQDVQDQLVGVKSIHATAEAFAALLENGTVVTWGNQNLGGNSDYVQDELYDIQSLHASAFGFIALRGDGKAIRWHNGTYKIIDNVVSVLSTDSYNEDAVLIRSDGNALVFDDTIEDFKSIAFVANGYIALQNNGELVAKGDVMSLHHADLLPRQFLIADTYISPK